MRALRRPQLNYPADPAFDCPRNQNPSVHAGGFIILARVFSQVEERLQAPAHLFLGTFQTAQTAHQAVPKAVFAGLVRRISAAEACSSFPRHLLGILKVFDRLLESSQGLSSRFVSYFPRCWWLCSRLSYYGRFAHTLVIRPKECPADGDEEKDQNPRKYPAHRTPP